MVSRSGILKSAAFGLLAFALAFGPTSAWADDLTGAPEGSQDELLANSWRYENGILKSDIDTGEPVVELDANDGIALLSDRTADGIELRGIDVSSHQKQIDWQKVKDGGIDFAIIRCGYAGDWTKYDDEYWEYNASECERLGIPYGVYLYSYAEDEADAISEANHALRLLEGHTPTLPVYYDLEDSSNLRAPSLAALASAFCTRIEQAGYTAGVYANLNWWRTYLTDPVFNSWDRWVAQYYSECTYEGDFSVWQYTSSGQVNGITTGNVDMNIAYVDFGAIASQDTWERIYGQHHLDTMASISKTGWASSPSVVIATEQNYWDALAASALAGLYDCPIILTEQGTLSKQAEEEISRLGATTAYVCGGPIAISSRVDDQLKAIGCTTVERVYGQDQQGTARSIAQRVSAGSSSKTCIIATSWKFQDALSISPYAFATKSPIYLTESGSNTLSDETLSVISQAGYTNAIVVGGPIAVSSTVDSQLDGIGVTVNRLYGQTEYETSAAIASWEINNGMGVSHLAVSTGKTYYDALAGSALCGRNNAVLLLMSDENRTCIDDFLSDYANEVDAGYVFGGNLAVSRKTWNMLVNETL